MKRSAKGSKNYSTDSLMRNIASSLIRDFQRNLNDPCFCSEYQREVSAGTIARIREVNPAIDCDSSVPYYKATYQMQSIFKRYRFQKDIYSDDELGSMAIAKFLDTQSRLEGLNFDDLDASSNLVLDLASRYVSKILGPYDDEEHRSLCRFGRKASVGVPARKACEAERWAIPITGSREQISWFHTEMCESAPVMNYLQAQLDSDPQGSIYREVDTLKLTLVPKTFKSLRVIMPNTTIGSYMSYGLGEMIRKRLKSGGYDIKTLQQRHRSLARLASTHGFWVTADLSSASDSITDALVRRLFPPDWYEILVQSRIGKVALPNGQNIESLTFCTMGVGYTFPLQTLVFLSLLKAIEATMYHRLDRRLISVYGDDMIYHVRIHSDVMRFFPQFGFVINVDKTFSEGHFRESCGGDYYRGVDVRPFQPQNGSATVTQKGYEAVLYKCINGLLARWSEYEIEWTLNYLVSEVERVTFVVKRVPVDFPDDAGVKCPALSHWDFLKRARCAAVKAVGHGIVRFPYLRLVPNYVEEKRHEPYCWLALRGLGEPAIDFDRRSQGLRAPGRLVAVVNGLTGLPERTSPLIWREAHDRNVRSKLSGRRLRRLEAFVTISHSGRYTRQYGTSCFEDRRESGY